MGQGPVRGEGRVRMGQGLVRGEDRVGMGQVLARGSPLSLSISPALAHAVGTGSHSSRGRLSWLTTG